MKSNGNVPSKELRALLAKWKAAIAELLHETNRLAAGGQGDLAHLTGLKAAVEVARQQCEQLSVRDSDSIL